MKSIFKSILGTKKKNNGIPKLVIGINQVDNLGEWDNDINQPTEETEQKIKERVNDIISKLTLGDHGASKEQIEYFSALRAYRLPQVINKIIHCTGVITTFKPKEITDPACSEGMSDENREYINNMLAEKRKKTQTVGLDTFMTDLMSKLDPAQGKQLEKILKDKKEKPINVAIIGQSGVGKSTTVNNLFGAKEKVSRIAEGTDLKNYTGYREYVLDDGSVMRVADLPGYGRGVQEDKKYKELYIKTLKNCDVILLIMQANDKAIVDDQSMIECLYEWSKEGLLTDDGSYYGQDTGLDLDLTIKEENSNPEPSKIADLGMEETSTSVEKGKNNFLVEIEEICENALKVLDKGSDEYQTIKKIFKLL